MFHASRQGRLASIGAVFGSRKRKAIAALTVLVLSVGSMTPAMAATSPTLSLSLWNGLVIVNGTGFNGNSTVQTKATMGQGSAQVSTRTWHTGQFLTAFRLPTTPNGTLNVESTGGGKTAKASRNFGSSNFEPAPSPAPTPTTAAPAVPTTTPPTTQPRPTTPSTTTPPTTSAPAQPSSARPAASSGGNWRMVFNDEFNGSSVDRNVWPECHWATRPGCAGQNPEELQNYRPGNVTISNGTAKLAAKRENYFNAAQNKTFNYTGASLATGPWGNNKSTFDFTYGYVEARLKTAPGKGVWSSLWMEPSSLSWPPEIDIMEHPNFNASEIHTNLHYRSSGGNRQTGQIHRGPNFNQSFNTIGLEWTSTSLTWYLNGQRIRTINDANIIPKVPMYPVMNTSVGGWAGSPNGTTFPSTFEVDYIRIWQR